MTPSEAAAVLTLAACYDGRIVGEADSRAWADLMPAVRLGDAIAAVKDHYRSETRRVMPADILAATKTKRDPW